jgi:hypothetical protein
MMMTRTFVSCSCAVIALAVVRVGTADEIVLTDGNKVSGTVFEETPGKSVRLLLDDGSIRELKAAEVKEIIYSASPTPPEPPAPKQKKPKKKPEPKGPPKGKLRVTTDEPGVVSIRRVTTRKARRAAPKTTEWQELGEVSEAKPFDRELPEGDYDVAIDFDAGGSDGGEVAIGPDATKEIQATGLTKLRQGLRFWIGGGFPALDLYLSGWSSLNGSVLGSLRLPLGGASDLRFGAELAFGAFGDPTGTPVVLPTVDAGVRLGLSSVYGMKAGVRLGGTFLPEAEVDSASFRIGPSWSILSLQMGPKRNVELSLDQAFDLLILPGFIANPVVTPVYHQNITVAVRVP